MGKFENAEPNGQRACVKPVALIVWNTKLLSQLSRLISTMFTNNIFFFF
jgi:hypothetical protein